MERVQTGFDWTIADERYWTRPEGTNSDVALQFDLQAGAEPFVPGILADFVIPFDGFIAGWQILSDGASSVEFDVWKEPSGLYPPDATNSIVGTTPPVLVNDTIAENLYNLTDWDVTVNKGDVLRLYLASETGVQRVVFVLYIQRPGALRESLHLLDEKADLVHDHDTRYYERTEIEALLTGGYLDGRYYTESEVDAMMAVLSATHDHDDRYYTESEVLDLLTAKANLNHSHDAAGIVSGTFDDARIPSLDAAKTTTGTFGASRIPNLDAGKITSGVFNVARIPTMDAGKITSGIFAIGRIPIGTTSTTVAAGDRAVPPGGTLGQVLSKNGATDYDVAWRSNTTPRQLLDNTTLTTYSLPDNTAGTFLSGNLDGTQAGREYLVIVDGMIDGYGSAGTTADLRLEVALNGVVQATGARMQFDQGVDSSKHILWTGLVNRPSGGVLTFALNFFEYTGIFDIRQRTLRVVAIPQ